jgi:quercetin dioxygenase-like cupin family protein
MLTPDRLTDRPPLDAPLLTFDVAEMLAEIEHEPAWASGHRNAMTLLKTPSLRLVLVDLHTGAKIVVHGADRPMTVQPVRGQLRLKADDHAVTLLPGQVAAIHPGIRQELEAMDDCAFLLTLVSDGREPDAVVAG